MIKKEWKNIVGFEELYQVSNYGDIRSKGILFIRNNNKKYTKTPKILKPSIDKDGYKRVSLRKTRSYSKSFYVHRLVAIAFIDNKNAYNIVNHIDNSKDNNFVENLEWTTVLGNNLHSKKQGRRKMAEEKLKKINEKRMISVKINGIKYESINEASRKTKIPSSTINFRLKRGVYE